MSHLEDSVFIAAPPAEVFAYVTDLGNTAKWHKNMKEVGYRSDDPPGLGTEYDWVESFMGKTMDLAGVITAWDPPHRYEWRPIDGPFEMSGGWTFEPDGAGTKVTRFSDTELSGVMKLTAGLMLPLARRQVRQELATLKQLVESELAK